MKESVLRAVSTVIPVAIGLWGAAAWGDTGAGKVATAVVVAIVIALPEWLFVVLPRHSLTARRFLDPRAVWEGAWMQVVTSMRSTEAGPESNRFALFVVIYAGDRYRINGTAYDEHGLKAAQWRWVGSPTFSRDGRELSYEWQGESTRRPNGDGGMGKSGLAKLELIDDESGSGRVDHVAASVQLDFHLGRMSRKFDPGRFSETWSRDYGEDGVLALGTGAVTDPTRRNVLARKLATVAAFRDVLAREYGGGVRRPQNV